MRRFYPPTRSDLPLRAWQPYTDMHLERIRAHDKHDVNGDSMERKRFDDAAWLSVLVEEVGEVARALCDFRHQTTDDATLREHLRDELVQVGAMTAAWLDAIAMSPIGDAGAQRVTAEGSGK
jgi:NTP pyrophosphatase (non-canonical NTP hydrolase)